MKIANLNIGDKAILNGNVIEKVSSRTIKILAFNRVFYFGKDETCKPIK